MLAPLICLVVAGCTPSPSAGGAESLDTGTESVMLVVEPRSEWRVLWIEGDTDLPDGAMVNYRATHELARTAPTEDLSLIHI